MTDLIVVSLESWNDVWRRNQHLAAGLLAADPDLRVLFVEPPADPAHDLATGRAPVWGHKPRRVPGQHRLVAYQPVKLLPRRLDPRTDERLARHVIRAARSVGFDRPLLWINDPSAAGVSSLSGWPTLYDITDDWLAADRPAGELTRLEANEKLLLATAAEVVACSPELIRRKSALRSGRPITLIPNAVDVDAYQAPTTRPRDLPARRVAVYVGTLHSDRLDVEITAQTAAALHPSGTLVLVGPDLLSAADSRRLRDAGALILGARTRDEVIAYLQHADTLVVPHLVNAFTASLDPIKLYEYQAVGRPVVSTAVAGFQDAESERIKIVRDDDFAETVREAVTATESASHGGSLTGLVDWKDRSLDMRRILRRLR